MQITARIFASDKDIFQYLGNMELRNADMRKLEEKFGDHAAEIQVDTRALLITLKGSYQRGITVFGNQQKWEHWMNTENTALGNKKPKDVPFEQVEEVMGRIEYGAFS